MNQQIHRSPIIGVTTRHGNPDWVGRNTKNYLHRLDELGATAVVLAPDTPARLPSGEIFQPDASGRLPDDLVARLDGLILSGGGDVDPAYFGAELNGAEPDSIDRHRDELELHLSRAALQADLPVFAICRGCQVLNVAAGGSMIQDFPGHRTPRGAKTVYHPITIQPQSRFHAILQQESLIVNTFHHQGLSRETLAPLFTPVATALPDEWLIEAYESPQHRWVIGVQWHPERTFELDPAHRRLWDSFYAACLHSVRTERKARMES